MDVTPVPEVDMAEDYYATIMERKEKEEWEKAKYLIFAVLNCMMLLKGIM